MRNRLVYPLGLLLFLAGPLLAQPTTPRAVLEAMKAAGANREATLTFVQTTIRHRPNGTVDTTTWYEAAVPGKLRIDFAPLEAGNGALYADGKQYVFQNGQLVDSQPDVNPLQLLLMDLFAYPLDRSTHLLDSLGYDLSVMHTASWQGRPVYVVGAAAGDTTRAQFWVDQERLISVRIMQPVGQNGQFMLDAQVPGWERIKGVWHENHILLYVNGRMFQEEHYHNIRTGIALDPNLFDPSHWSISTPYWQ